VGAGDRADQGKPEARAAVVTGAEPVEDEVQPVRRDAGAAVGDHDPGRPAGPAFDDRQLYDIAPGGMPDGVLAERVERQAEPFPVGAHPDLVQQPDPPGPLGGRAPAADQVHAHLVQRDQLGVEEFRVVGGGDQQQALGDPAQPAQLADHDLEILPLLVPVQVGGQQLGVPQRDRDRGPQLVRRVLQELALAVQQPRVLLAEAPGGGLGGLLAAHVPDHRDEGGRH
jgi:hypothetical protein